MDFRCCPYVTIDSPVLMDELRSLKICFLQSSCGQTRRRPGFGIFIGKWGEKRRKDTSHQRLKDLEGIF